MCPGSLHNEEFVMINISVLKFKIIFKKKPKLNELKAILNGKNGIFQCYIFYNNTRDWNL